MSHDPVFLTPSSLRAAAGELRFRAVPVPDKGGCCSAMQPMQQRMAEPSLPLVPTSHLPSPPPVPPSTHLYACTQCAATGTSLVKALASWYRQAATTSQLCSLPATCGSTLTTVAHTQVSSSVVCCRGPLLV